MAAHSSILAWKIPWTEEPGGYRPWSHKELDTAEHPWTNGHLSNFFQILIRLEYQLSLNFKRSLMNTTGFMCPTSHFFCEVFFHLDFPEIWVILVFIYFPWLQEILWATQDFILQFCCLALLSINGVKYWKTPIWVLSLNIFKHVLFSFLRKNS